DHWLNSLGMVTLLYGPVEKSLLPTGSGGLKPPKGLDSVKDFEVKKPLPAFSTNEGFQFKINNLDVDTPALPQTPMQINFKNEMDRIFREKMEGKSESNHSIKDVEVKAVEGTGNGVSGSKSSYSKNIDDFLSGNKKFGEVLDDYATVYAEKVNSNVPWKWRNVPGGDTLTQKQIKLIRERAKELEKIPDVPMKPGVKHPDFEKADLIIKIDENPVILQLPKDYWKKSDPQQFQWLDSQLPGGKRPPGTTWHHSEIDGRMELVPFGIHNSINHQGGRAPGGWAHAKR
ncbi:HNH endonuclease signature motif containing protein, partial [Paenibacillus odorifer]|uniref:HNH endonuclease signature motif containing protein n=2 Tax=Paenibacillus TaxID=44249 RepID=UPI00117E8E3B